MRSGHTVFNSGHWDAAKTNLPMLEVYGGDAAVLGQNSDQPLAGR